ncbi:MAG: hypothetical protein GY755_08605 [Chloroflexi bacterium]|nr:hypothetical protein [Chloroflexota bacterium]
MRKYLYSTMVGLHLLAVGVGFVAIYECIFFYNKASILMERTINEKEKEERYIRALYVADARGYAAIHAAIAAAAFTFSSLMFSWSREFRKRRE